MLTRTWVSEKTGGNLMRPSALSAILTAIADSSFEQFTEKPQRLEAGPGNADGETLYIHLVPKSARGCVAEDARRFVDGIPLSQNDCIDIERRGNVLIVDQRIGEKAVVPLLEIDDAPACLRGRRNFALERRVTVVVHQTREAAEQMLRHIARKDGLPQEILPSAGFRSEQSAAA